MRVEVWTEGYMVTGCEGIPVPASRLIMGEFESFDAAVECWLTTVDEDTSRTVRKREDDHGDSTWSFWGCTLYDNETDARKNFG